MRNRLRLPGLALILVLAGCSSSGDDGAAPAPLPPSQYVLNVSRLLEGSVVSEPAGINCGTQCSASFPADTLVRLSAVPAEGRRFVEWRGACMGSGACELRMDNHRLLTAVFGPTEIVDPPPGAKACAPYDGPALTELKQYEGLMHEHSSYSDGLPTAIPADYFRVATTAGYDFVGSAEHSDSLDALNFITLHAYCDPTSDQFDPTSVEYCFLNPSADKLVKWASMQTQAREASSEHFLGIRGFEWTSDVFGHINVYFSSNFTNAKTDLGYALTMDTFWEWFSRDPATPGLGGSLTSIGINGGAGVPFGGGSDALAHFNHPHDKCLTEDDPTGLTTGFCDWNDYELIPDAVERMFGMEVYNDGNRDDRYLPYYMRALDKGWRLAPVGSEDEHFGEYAVEHRPKTVTLATELSEAGFREAWLARRTMALSPGWHLRADLRADGDHPMGSRLSCDSGKTVPMTVRLTQKDGRPFSGEYRLYTSGAAEPLATIRGSEARFDLPVPLASGETRWYFVRAHGGEDNKSVAYLSPVWVTAK
ncbi:MAG: hypothetical protein Q8Q73_15240 [Stagnimonas sp.]|nr:hypothetical protein [Stagnimonas sp.]